MTKKRPASPKVVALYAECDGKPMLLLDDGRNFKALFKAFNKQDQHQDEKWQDLETFLEKRGVKILRCPYFCLDFLD